MIFKKGQELVLDIEKLVYGGEGLAKKDNFTIFVPETVPQDKVRVEIISVKPSYARALVKEFIEKSPFRVEPKCSITETCGGCQWQEIDYKKQLEFKEKNVIESLNKIGKISLEDLNETLIPIKASDNEYYYRNKAQFPFGEADGDIKAGFYSTQTHNIIETDKCYIQNDKINQVFRKVKALVKKYQVSVYNEYKNKGLLRHLVVRHSLFTDQILVGFVTTQQEFKQLNSIIKDLTTDFVEIKTIVQNINSEKTNTILGKKTIVHYGEGYITEQLQDLQYKISLNSFFQVNPVQTINLYNCALDFASLTGEETMLDAYAGAGTIGLWMAKKLKKVIGIEIVEEAVKNGKENAKLNNISNFELICGKVEEEIPTVFKNNKIDIVVLDPPRKGCEDYIFDIIDTQEVSKIVYISCNPSTLARDAKLLYQSGYKLKKFQAFDMFPHTYHVETVALFEK